MKRLAAVLRLTACRCLPGARLCRQNRVHKISVSTLRSFPAFRSSLSSTFNFRSPTPTIHHVRVYRWAWLALNSLIVHLLISSTQFFRTTRPSKSLPHSIITVPACRSFYPPVSVESRQHPAPKRNYTCYVSNRKTGLQTESTSRDSRLPCDFPLRHAFSALFTSRHLVTLHQGDTISRSIAPTILC